MLEGPISSTSASPSPSATFPCGGVVKVIKVLRAIPALGVWEGAKAPRVAETVAQCAGKKLLSGARATKDGGVRHFIYISLDF